MYDFHKNKQRYFNMQYELSSNYIVPFVNDYIDNQKKLNVLEIGCAEAGVLKAFTEKNHQCVGIELQASRVELAKQFLAKEYENKQITFIAQNIYHIDIMENIGHTFDLIILKDVIEHIHDQDKIIKRLKAFLSPNGKIFFSFPPWYMPYGGHQQVCRGKLASLLPYYHLLPTFLYRAVLKLFGEEKGKIDNLVEIKETGISIERFERILKKNNFKIVRKQPYLFNPIYKYKFNLTPRKQNKVIYSIPYFRNFVTSCMYYLVRL